MLWEPVKTNRAFSPRELIVSLGHVVLSRGALGTRMQTEFHVKTAVALRDS